MKTVIKQLLLVCAALTALSAFASCEVIADTSALIQTPETIWISLTPTKAVEGKATLVLDFDKAIAGLDETLDEAGLAELFTFEYKEQTSSIKTTGVKKSVVGIYTLTVENVPDDDEGTVLVTINKSGIAPATRLWSLNGEVVPNADLTAALVDFRFEKSNNAALPEDAVGGIDPEAGTVVVVAPSGASRNSLIPTLKTNPGNTFKPEAQTNFSESVLYTVSTAKSIAVQNQKTYTVNVMQQTEVSASILFFGFTKEENSAAGITASVSGVIDEDANPKTISVTVPDGTNVSALKPNIVHSGATISPANLARQDFTNSINWTVTSVSGAPIVYAVTVTQGAATDTRRTLNAGAGAGVAAAATTADVTFTNASGLTLNAADFALSTGGAISAVSVVSDTATVTLTFASNTTAADKTYTVSIAAGSPTIKGSATVGITQGAFSGTGGEGTIVSIGGIPDFNMRYIPPTPVDGFQRNGTASNMTIITQGYWMGETEVTQELFEAVMGVNPSNFSDNPADGETQAKRPVEQVSWYDAITFCNKLSLLDGRTPVYSVSGIADWAELAYSSIPSSDDETWNAAAISAGADGYRLPTEMEGMWACMGATAGGADVTTAGYLKGYAGSTEGSSLTNVGNYAWYNSNSGSKTHEAGKKTANELGIYDMSGNVFELCWDWAAAESSGTLTDYTGLVSDDYRVFRGGSWYYGTDYLHSTFRDGSTPSGRYNHLGFRLVRP